MATIVLLHGAWGGGWQWERLRPLLENEGHRVLAPSLAGMGDRAHLIGPDVGLETHIDDIVGLIESERLSDVILVGHSYAGMVMAGVAGHVPDRLSHLVYIDAFLPEPGQSVADIMPVLVELCGEPTSAEPYGYPLPPMSMLVESGFTTVAEAEWVAGRATTAPVLAFLQPLPPHRKEGASSLPGTYLWCGNNTLQEPTAKRAAADGLDVITWGGAGHWLPLFEPARTAQILHTIAARIDQPSHTHSPEQGVR